MKLAETLQLSKIYTVPNGNFGESAVVYMYIYKYCSVMYILKMMNYSVRDTGILRKRKSEFSYQESNLRPSDD